MPAQLTIKSGDVVRYLKKSGGPHNVQFYQEIIPPGAAAVLEKVGKISSGTALICV